MKISVITATLNSLSNIKVLYKSLKEQTDKNFDWIIADGNSEDGTIDYLKNINDLNIILSIKKDIGIYDALNRAIKLSSNKYYVVIGSDDIFNIDAIKNFRKTIKKESADIIASKWIVEKKILSPKKNFGWLYGMLGVSSCHSVATLINSRLHKTYGFYSLNFPICADQLFIKKVIYGGCKVVYPEFISGTFSKGGNSSSNLKKFLKEQYLIQYETEKIKFLQTIFFFLRKIKHFKKLYL